MYFSTATCGSESWSIITVGLIMMYHLRCFKVVRESVDMLKPPRAAVAVAVVHGDDDLREDLLRQPPRFLRGKSGAAAGGYHQRVRAEYAPNLAAVELGADVSHISTPGIYSHAMVSGVFAFGVGKLLLPVDGGDGGASTSEVPEGSSMGSGSF